ncbi:hypothetical protein BHM03_00061466 [Ensete ventricosum]|nr:hypothetical protein BHM03_00061466 [Ensete ventricosum]
MKHKEDCLVQDPALMRRDQTARGGRRDNTLSLPSTVGPQVPNGARTTRRERRHPAQCGASSSHRCSDVRHAFNEMKAKNAVLQYSVVMELL